MAVTREQHAALRHAAFLARGWDARANIPTLYRLPPVRQASTRPVWRRTSRRGPMAVRQQIRL